MKILFITSHHRLYGANRSMLTIIKYLKESGYDITVLTPFYSDLAESLEKDDINCIVFPYYPSFMYYKPRSKHLLSPLFGFITFLLLPILLRKIKVINPDIVYSNSSAENLGLLIAKILKKKHILHVREFLSLDYNLHFWGGDKYKKNYINKSDGVLFVSKTVANKVIGNINPKKHLVVYNGFPIIRDESRKKIDLLDNKINLSIVGTINEAKGQLESIDYCKELLLQNANIVLNFYGDGDENYIKKIKGKIEKFNLQEKVILHGYIADTKVIYQQTDVLLVFAKHEGFGRVTIEAMLKYIPVIGYNSGGTAELISNNVNGYLFSCPISFRKVFDELLIKDNYLKISQVAFSTACDNFSDKNYGKKVENFIQYIYAS